VYGSLVIIKPPQIFKEIIGKWVYESGFVF